MVVRTAAAVETLGALVDWSPARHVDLLDLVVERPSLEDIYLELTRRAE